jgi:hypothetical protein
MGLMFKVKPHLTFFASSAMQDKSLASIEGPIRHLHPWHISMVLRKQKTKTLPSNPEWGSTDTFDS